MAHRFLWKGLSSFCQNERQIFFKGKIIKKKWKYDEEIKKNFYKNIVGTGSQTRMKFTIRGCSKLSKCVINAFLNYKAIKAFDTYQDVSLFSLSQKYQNSDKFLFNSPVVNFFVHRFSLNFCLFSSLYNLFNTYLRIIISSMCIYAKMHFYRVIIGFLLFSDIFKACIWYNSTPISLMYTIYLTISAPKPGCLPTLASIERG